MSRVNKKVVTQEYINGGLQIVEIENFDASMKISWVKKMLKITDPPKWLKILGETIDIDKIIKLGPNCAFIKGKNCVRRNMVFGLERSWKFSWMGQG